MKWSEAENTIRIVFQRLTGGGLGIIPDALYLLNTALAQANRLSLLLVYHEAPLSDDEREQLYRRVAYLGGSELPQVRSVLFLTNGLNVVLETAALDQPPVSAMPAGARLLWKPGLDWSITLNALSSEFQPQRLPLGREETGSHLIIGEV